MKDLNDQKHKEVKASNRGDVAAEAVSTEKLFKKHASFIASFLHRLGVHDADIDDVVQEVFMVVHKKGGYVPGPAQPRSWLAAIALLVAKASRRRQGKRREAYDETLLTSLQAEGKTPDQALQIARSMQRVQTALDTLDLSHRAVFILYELEGESCQAISESLQIPLGTIYSRLHIARKRFSKAYTKLISKHNANTDLEQVKTP